MTPPRFPELHERTKPFSTRQELETTVAEMYRQPWNAWTRHQGYLFENRRPLDYHFDGDHVLDELRATYELPIEHPIRQAVVDYTKRVFADAATSEHNTLENAFLYTMQDHDPELLGLGMRAASTIIQTSPNLKLRVIADRHVREIAHWCNELHAYATFRTTTELNDNTKVNTL